MKYNINKETNRINAEINVPRLLINDKFYLDFSSLMELTKLNRSKLYRMLQQINGLNLHSLKYKNRLYLEEQFILLYFRFLLQ